MRKIIAARMTEATQTIPHFRVTVDVEADALSAVREKMRQDDATATPTLNDLIVKVCATALVDTPGVNIQWANEEIHEYDHADISIVVAVPGGLATPIVRAADTKGVRQIAREIKELAARAEKNALKVDEIVGGTFSISNLGMFGVDSFDAVINSPQCAILSVGTAKPHVVASKTGEVRVATVMTLTLSCDHRAIDGTTGSKFLALLRERLEQPANIGCII